MIESGKFDSFPSCFSSWQEYSMNRLARLATSLATMIAGLGSAAWSPAAHACAAEPLIASVCIMGLNPGARFQSMNNSYMLAAGQTLALNQYTALYSLLGTTFGGNGSTSFNLPDLRGKVVVGLDPRDATRAVGANGGSAAIQLTVAQLPQHAATIVNMPVTLTTVQATTTLTGLAATANLAGVVLQGPASGLNIRAVSTGGGQASPNGNYLGRAPGSTSALYSGATPDVSLNAGSITGDLSLTVNPGVTAPVNITGSAATSVTGGGTASGTSAVIGAGAAIPAMPPYLVLPYYIAYNGIYPSGD
jgi:microcystin-dependent protein